ncbi:MAG TPA: cytochrome c oxidase assembly protein [Paracoccaceae bacterium]|nr:cytochrome c oxidase assembly protein [Paracoccaceae bacterium]
MRAAALIAGGAIALAAWFAPVATPLWPFADHMARHMAVVALAAPLLAIGLPHRLSAALPHVPVLPATLAEFVTVWGWHLPAAHAAAQTSTVWFAVQHACFLAVGLALWRSALAPGRALAGAGGMLLTSMHMTLLGALLILATRELYPSGICGGPADQQLGGMLMLGIGTPIYLMAGLALTARALAEERPA